MKTIIKSILLISLSFLLPNCKECEEVISDRKVKLTVIDNTTSEDISSTLTADNFYIRQTDTPGAQLEFIIEFGLTPLPTSIIAYACRKSSEERYSNEYGIWKDQQNIGSLKVYFVKIKNNCKDCNYSIENIELINIDGEVTLQEFDNKITLIIN